MKVKELIAHLEKCNQESIVKILIEEDSGGWTQEDFATDGVVEEGDYVYIDNLEISE